MRAVVLVVSLLVVTATPAKAFHNESEYLQTPLRGGGGGNYFTGSSGSRGFDCSICHVNSSREVWMTIGSEPVGLIETGEYVPGQTYRLSIDMLGEHRGVDALLNRNSFMLEAVDDDEKRVGTYDNPSEFAFEVGQDGGVIAGRGAGIAQTHWEVDWIAPVSSRGVTFYLAGVDGDGADDRLSPDGDPFGDDVFAAAVRLVPNGSENRAETELATSCRVGRGSGENMVWLLLLGSWLLLCWRRPARGRLLWPLTGALVLNACGTAEPPTDCTRTICAPDASVGQLDAGQADTHHDVQYDAHHDANVPQDAHHDVGHDAHHDVGPEVSDVGTPDVSDGATAMCEGSPVSLAERGWRVCNGSCYCGSPERCFDETMAETCCEGPVICPVGGESYSGCEERGSVGGEGGPHCESGECFCSTDLHCYQSGTADACCDGEIQCF